MLNAYSNTKRQAESRLRGFLGRANLLAAAFTFCFATAAGATDRFFPDLTAQSPNKRFQLKVRSPDNASRYRRPTFQSRFNYRLTDQQQGRERWSRDQRRRDKEKNIAAEGPPAAAYVSDEGWTVIRTADARARIELIVISPEGEETIRVDLFSALFPNMDEIFDYTVLSTAGRHWGASYCHFYFETLQGSPHFCLRTWWDKRVLLNLDEGRQVPLDEPLRRQLFETEKEFVMDALERTGDWTWTTGKHGQPTLSRRSRGATLREGMKAIHMAGRMKLREAVPRLQQLQSCPYIGPTSSSRGPYKPFAHGINPYVRQSLTVRQLSQLSLRRIGVRPSGHQATTLYREDNGYWRPDDPLTFARELRVAEINEGLKPEEVLTKIGAPDYIDFGGWEYDMDSETPYTLIISWGVKGVDKSDSPYAGKMVPRSDP